MNDGGMLNPAKLLLVVILVAVVVVVLAFNLVFMKFFRLWLSNFSVCLHDAGYDEFTCWSFRGRWTNSVHAESLARPDAEQINTWISTYPHNTKIEKWRNDYEASNLY